MVFVFAIAGFNLRTDYTYNITTELENVYYSSKHESDPCFLFCFSTKKKGKKGILPLSKLKLEF